MADGAGHDEQDATEASDGSDGAAGIQSVQPDDFEAVLRHLRRLAAPCEPPIGVGSFDLLYASAREVVVWYTPAREHQQPGEVAIPCTRLAVAWAALASGQALDEPALRACGGGVGGGRWLLALLAQLPGVRVREDPLALTWDASAIEALPPASESPKVVTPRRSRARRTKVQAGPRTKPLA